MFFILYLFIGTISGLVAVLPMMLVFHFIALKRNKPSDGREKFLYMLTSYIFCTMIIAILSVTGITGIPDIHNQRAYINLIPFIDISTNYGQYLLNIVLFIPVGFLLPMIWEHFKKKRLLFTTGLLFSLFIELMQLFGIRATDIDDLMMNTAGTIVGYYLFVLIKRIFPKISVFSDSRIKRWKWESCVYFAFALLGMAFIQPFIEGWIWGLVL